MIKFIASFLFFVSISAHTAEVISIVSLLANPDKFHGKCVQVAGVIGLEFELPRIYLNRESYNGRVIENSVSQPVELTDDWYLNDEIKSKFEGKLVRYKGVFWYEPNRTPNGYFSNFVLIETMWPDWQQVKPNRKEKCL